MFCNRCGKPIEGDKILCDECAAANAPAATPAEPPVEAAVAPEAPAPEAVVEEPAFVLGSTEPPKKKKKKTGLILGIVAVVIAALAAAVALNWNWITGLFTPGEEPATIVPPEEHMQQVEMSAVEKEADKLANVYENLLTAKPQSSLQGGSVVTNLKLGDTTIAMLQPYIPEEVGDISWLNDISLGITYVTDDAGLQAIVSAGLGNTPILTFDVACDLENSMVYITIPELSDTPLQMAVDPETISAFQTAMQDSAATQQTVEAVLQCLPDKETFRKLVVDYMELIIGELDKVTESEATLSIGDKSVKVTALTAKIGARDFIDIADAVFTKAKDDAVILQFMDDLASTLGELYPDADFSGMKTEYVSTLTYALENMDDARESADTTTALRLTTYVDQNDKIIGRKLSVSADGNAMEIVRYTVIENGKDDYTFEIAFNAGLVTGSSEYTPATLTGTSVRKNGKLNFVCNAIWQDNTYLTLEIKDGSESGGTLRIIPGKALLDLINEEMDLGLPTSVLDQNMALELYCHAKAETAEMGIKVVLADEALVDLSFTVTQEDLKVMIPESGVDVEDEEAINAWASEIDIEAYVELLEEAGVPSELLEQIVTSLFGTAEEPDPSADPESSLESDFELVPDAA